MKAMFIRTANNRPGPRVLMRHPVRMPCVIRKWAFADFVHLVVLGSGGGTDDKSTAGNPAQVSEQEVDTFNALKALDSASWAGRGRDRRA